MCAVVHEVFLCLRSQILNPETEFHYKNRSKHWDKLFWEDKFGISNTYAVSPPFSTYKDPCGWLVNLINRVSLDLLRNVFWTF